MSRRHDSRDDEDSGDEERPEEKPPSTKKTLQDPRTLRRPVQYRAESFDEHYSYERQTPVYMLSPGITTSRENRIYSESPVIVILNPSPSVKIGGSTKERLSLNRLLF
ncbi:hypothetical protein AVEN_4687-1 [Araneus ventricosus]|uniref:Uncharacterized protein n=1 Tax=Araneus ventricosus TaxID=182803 RepID=A0A4Y2QX36_ARAVE|nr:hypothetical protein AVEN_4687-1 [Araneus ventricosus]